MGGFKMNTTIKQTDPRRTEKDGRQWSRFRKRRERATLPHTSCLLFPIFSVSNFRGPLLTEEDDMGGHYMNTTLKRNRLTQNCA